MLTLVFELSSIGEHISAWREFKLCEELLEQERNKDGKTYSMVQEALIHVLLSTKVHLLLRSDCPVEARQVVQDLQMVKDMSVEGLAALQGLKAWFFHHYRGEGARLALQCARQALALIPNSPLWMILTSQSLRRVRKLQSSLEEVSSEEVELLEGAVEQERSPRHLLLLAQAYREAGECKFQKHRNDQDFYHSQTFHEISEIQQKSFDLYKEAISLRPDSEVVNRLCGYGLLKLPAFKSDYRLAEYCLQRALEQDPRNSTTIHALGLHYYKSLMDYEKAALYCEKAGKLGNFPASLDMLRMKRLVYGSNYDPVFDFQKLLHQYGDDHMKRHEILCQMGSYYLFFERNLEKALKYFETLVKENAELSIMTSHKCTFLNMACKINMFQFIVNEGLHLLQENKERVLGTEEKNIQDLQKFLDDLKLTKPELFEVPINVNLIDDLHKVSDEIKQTYARKKERRHSTKEKWRESVSEWGSSLDSNAQQTSLRRQSDGNLNFRRRSSGNVEVFQNRSSKKPNRANNKQSIEISTFEGIIKQRSGSRELDDSNIALNSNIFRHGSSEAKIDLGPNLALKSLHQRKKSFVTESLRVFSQDEAQKPHESVKMDEFGWSNESQNRTPRGGSGRPYYKRYLSWSGSTVQYNQTNWRIKD
ncbi:uncharacterized protein LOC128987279 isoform X2 [Macrosteles quadrilineatus]|nr:uncharacterized protein LOC128987279 isoform X2 [Macrosteles quadrilineatus]